MSLIDAAEVHRIFLDCLFKEEEIPPGKTPEAVVAEGITVRIGFHPERLESHRADVKKLVDNLPDEFFPSAKPAVEMAKPERTGGGGYSFLKLPFDKNGNQWGEHNNAQELMMLAVGLKLMTCCLPRELWHTLPGGVPYLAVS